MKRAGLQSSGRKGASLINSDGWLLLCKIGSLYWILLCKTCGVACGFEIEKSPAFMMESRTGYFRVGFCSQWRLLHSLMVVVVVVVVNLREEARIIRRVPRVLREVVVWRVGVWRWMGRRVDRLLGLHVPTGASRWLLARHVRAGRWAGCWGTVLHVARRWRPTRGTASWNIQKRMLC